MPRIKGTTKDTIKDKIVEKKQPKNVGLEALLSFEEELGDTSAFKKRKTDINIISTGSPLLNDLTIVGGLPRGRIIQYYGPFGGGKTFLAMIAAKNVLDSDPNAHVVWFDAENTFDFEWAESIGIWSYDLLFEDPDTEKEIDKNRLRVLPINDGKDIFKTITGEKKEAYKGKAPAKKKGVLDFVNSGELNCPLIIIDSLAAIIPPGEDTSPIGKQNISLLSRFLPVEFRRMSTLLTQADVCLLCINQVTTNIGDPYADKFTFSGGEKLRHWLSLNVFIDKINQKEGKILMAKDNPDTSIGQQIKLIIKKSKFGPYPRSCKSKVCFLSGEEYTGKKYEVGIVDVEKEWIELGVHYDVISKGGAWFTFGNEKHCGIDAFAKEIKQKPALLETLKEKIKSQKLKGKKNNMHIEDDEEAYEIDEETEKVINPEVLEENFDTE